MMLRSAQASDVPGIARVHVESWKTTYAGLIPASYLAGLTLADRERLWVASLPQPGRHTLVALEGDAIVGFAHAGPNRGPESAYAGELYALYVLASHHRRGLGRALFRRSADLLAGAGHPSMITWVLDGNPARGFYERMGGAPAGSKRIMIGGEFLLEHAYAWQDTSRLGPDPEPR